MGREGYTYLYIYFQNYSLCHLFTSLWFLSLHVKVLTNKLFVWCLQHLCQNVNWHQQCVSLCQ